MAKQEMSRRVRRHYLAILNGNGSSYCDNWKWWGGDCTKQNAWAAFFFFKQFGTRKDVDFYQLQKIILKGEPELIYRFAKEIPRANIRKCQIELLERGSPVILRTFAKNIPGARKEEIEAMCLIME